MRIEPKNVPNLANNLRAANNSASQSYKEHMPYIVKLRQLLINNAIYRGKNRCSPISG